MTLVLLDTNAYLRLAKRVRPAVGVTFGQKGYTLTILKAVEDEVHRSARLKAKYPWFDNDEFVNERLAKQTRLSPGEKLSIQAAQSVLHGWVLQDVERFTSGGRSPPLVQLTVGCSPTGRLSLRLLSRMILECMNLPKTSAFRSGTDTNYLTSCDQPKLWITRLFGRSMKLWMPMVT